MEQCDWNVKGELGTLAANSENGSFCTVLCCICRSKCYNLTGFLYKQLQTCNFFDRTCSTVNPYLDIPLLQFCPDRTVPGVSLPTQLTEAQYLFSFLCS